MKILFPYMARWKAVNWTRYHSILTCLAEMGHEIHVLQPPSCDLQETNFQEIRVNTPKNLHLTDIEIPKIIWNRKIPFEKLIKKGIYSSLSLETAKKIVRDKKIDMILTYNIPQYRFMRIKGPKKVFDYADDYINMLGHELGGLNNPAFLWLGRRIFNDMTRRADYIFSVSNVLKNNLGAGANSTVLPNGVDMADADYALRHPMELPFKKPVIGFVGAFEYFIDFDLILNTARAMPEATFLLVGSGRLLNDVRKKAEGLNNIFLTGGVPHKDVFRYIGAMDICLNIFRKIPVSHAACPIKLFEFISMKKPVISTRLDELTYINKNFLMYADTPEEIKTAVQRLMSDHTLRARITTGGYKEVIENYTWQSIAEKFERITAQPNLTGSPVYQRAM